MEELEGHLRDQLAALTEAGLAGDEAFLVAVKRMGSLDALSREFARAHSERLWKQLVMAPDAADESANTACTETLVVLGLAVAAALAIKVPALFGLPLSADEEVPPFYFRNASLFVLPLLAVYFIWKRGSALRAHSGSRCRSRPGPCSPTSSPSRAGSDTERADRSAPANRPVAGRRRRVRPKPLVRRRRTHGLRAVLGRAGDLLRAHRARRGRLTAFTVMMFAAIGMNAEWLIGGWLVPCGAAGAVIIGSWLVEAKQSVIENMAPVLTRLFTPLFTILLLAFLATMAWTGSPINVKREVLIGFDLLLVVVVGLVLYAASARDPQAPPDFFDGLQLLLVVSALVVDGVALAAIAARISEFGFTPNRVAALGENLILLVNLAWSAWLYASLPASPGLVCRPGAMADRLSARVLRVGGAGGRPVPAGVRLPLSDLHSQATTAFRGGTPGVSSSPIRPCRSVPGRSRRIPTARSAGDSRSFREWRRPPGVPDRGPGRTVAR